MNLSALTLMAVLSLSISGCAIPREPVQFASTESPTSASLVQSVGFGCFPGKSAIVALESSEVQLKNASRSDGWIFLDAQSRMSSSAQVSIVGGIFRMLGSSIQGSALITYPGVQQIVDGDPRFLFTQIVEGANAPMASPALPAVLSTQFFERQGATTVLDFAEGIELSGNDRIILSGSVTDHFILRIKGRLHLSGKAGIALLGGLHTSNVVVEIQGAESQVLLEDQSGIAGTLVTSSAPITMKGASTIVGAVLTTQNISLEDSASVVHPEEFCLDLSTF